MSRWLVDVFITETNTGSDKSYRLAQGIFIYSFWLVSLLLLLFRSKRVHTISRDKSRLLRSLREIPPSIRLIYPDRSVHKTAIRNPLFYLRPSSIQTSTFEKHWISIENLNRSVACWEGATARGTEAATGGGEGGQKKIHLSRSAIAECRKYWKRMKIRRQWRGRRRGRKLKRRQIWLYFSFNSI